MSWTKYENIKTILHPGSFHDVKKWLASQKASLSDKELDNLALESIIQSSGANKVPDTEQALKLFNIKLKQHIHNLKE